MKRRKIKKNLWDKGNQDNILKTELFEIDDVTLSDICNLPCFEEHLLKNSVFMNAEVKLNFKFLWSNVDGAFETGIQWIHRSNKKAYIEAVIYN